MTSAREGWDQAGRSEDTVTRPYDAALELAAGGWRVFPCKWAGDNAKAPLTLRGHLEATADPEQIRAWWTRWPNAMIGAPVPATLLVVDLDPRNNPTCEADLLRQVGSLPATLTAWSGRGDGGRHLYYLRPPGQLISTRLPAGVDLKVNGYCIVPPSLHPASGQPYRWDQRPAVKMSPGLRSLLRPVVKPRGTRSASTPGDGQALVRWLERQTSNANDALYWAARRAAARGELTPELETDLVAAAAAVAARAGTLGKNGGERGSWKTIESAKRAGEWWAK